MKNKCQHSWNWEPVPSLNYKYELNSNGDLRNTVTKKVLTLFRGNQYNVMIDGKTKAVYKTSLLWEVFGIIPNRIKPPAIPTIINNGNQRFQFENLKSTANFLVTKIFYSRYRIETWLHQRKAEIKGWKITYCPPKGLTAVTDSIGDWVNCRKPKNDNWLKEGVVTAEAIKTV